MLYAEEQTIREMSDKAFKDHVITERFRSGVFRCWRCQKPGSWAYGFDLTTTPGSLIVTGDLGSIVLCREFDMLPWARKSVDDLHYFAEKMTAGPEKKTFSHALVAEWLKQQIADQEHSGEQIGELRQMLKYHDEHCEGWMMEETQFVWEGNDPPNWKEWNPSLMWLRDAIRWFVTNHTEPAIE